MGKVFIRKFYPYIKSGVIDPDSAPKLVACAEQWKTFENMLESCLMELGCQIIAQQDLPRVPDCFEDAEFRIYAHETRRTAQGDLFYKQMHLPNLFTIDHTGWGAEHSKMQQRPDLSDIDAAEAERFAASLRDEFLKTGASKLPQPGRRETGSLPYDYIFAPTQTPRDYVQLHHAPITILDFIHIVARWADSSKQNVVFKLHPGTSRELDGEIFETANACAEESRYVFCLNSNVHDLIANARGVFTINSGVGFESLIHGKPVATFGDCDYKWVTFRADADNLNRAGEFIFSYADDLRREAFKFLYHYFFHHALNMEAEHIAKSRNRLIEYLSREISRHATTESMYA